MDTGKLFRSGTEINNKLANNPSDEYNANNGYLMEFLALIDQWRMTMLSGVDGAKNTKDYFEQLISIADIFLDLLSARIKHEDVVIYEDRLEEHTTKIAEAYYTNAEGTLMFYPDVGRELQKDIRKTFRSLMAEMQKIGMLTKLHLSPSEAITELE